MSLTSEQGKQACEYAMRSTSGIPEKFTGDHNKRLPKEEGERVIKSGCHISDGELNKDCYWAGYELGGKFYISLNRSIDFVWEASEEDMKLHCTE